MHHLRVMFGCLLVRLSSRLPFVPFLFRMIDEDNVVPDTTQIRAVLSLGSVDKIGIRELTNEIRDLGTHSVLRYQCFVRESLQHEALEEGSIQIESVALLDGEEIMVYFRA